MDSGEYSPLTEPPKEREPVSLQEIGDAVTFSGQGIKNGIGHIEVFLGGKPTSEDQRGRMKAFQLTYHEAPTEQEGVQSPLWVLLDSERPAFKISVVDGEPLLLGRENIALFEGDMGGDRLRVSRRQAVLVASGNKINLIHLSQHNPTIAEAPQQSVIKPTAQGKPAS